MSWTITTSALQYLFWTVAFLVVIFATIVLLRLKIVPAQVRRLYQLDGLDEMIGSCGERGRPLVCHNQYDISNPAATQATNWIFKYLGEKCAPLNVPVFSTSLYPQVQVINEDWLRQGYIASGYPERYQPGRFMSSPNVELAMIGMIQREHAGGILCLLVGNRASTYYDAALREGALILGETPYGFSSCWNSIMCDWYMNGDEVMAMATYVSHDQQMLENLISIDAAKLLFVGGYIITWIVRSLLGNPFGW